jgi:multidrug efflux pump subunit AcrA (membrane-fusion protein)
MVCAVALVATLVTSACLPTLPSGTAPTSTPRPDRATTTRIGKAVRGDLNGVLSFTGSIQAKGQVAVVPQVIARIDQIKVDVGSRVRAGDVLVELDHTVLDQQVLVAQASQASAEARLAQLKAGPKAEVLAQAQANQKAAQARFNALQGARGNADIATLDARVRDARAALDQATAALTPDAAAIATADAAAAAARTRLAQLQADPTKANDKPTMDAARADVTRLEAAATAARTPSGSQAAVENARRDLQDAQQAQLLARLSTTAFDLDQARALLDVANAQVDLANAPASQEEITAAETTVEEAFAQAELARGRVRQATITAPIAGVVTSITGRVGDTASPSTALVTMIPPDMQIVVQAEEGQLSQLQTGQSANLSIESYPKDAFSGTVRAIAPVLDPRTRTVAVQIDVPDPQGKLKPGMFAQLAIQLGQRPGVLMVPREAIVRVGAVDPSAPPQTVVFTLNESRVHRQVVSLGTTDGKNVEVLNGLQEGVDLVLNPRPDFIEGELLTAG